MLRLDEIHRDDITLITDQSELWIRHFSGTSTAKWNQAKHSVNMNIRCNIKSDIVFVVDSSISISPEDLEQTKRMISNYTHQLATLGGHNKVGVILIRTTADVHMTLGPPNGLRNDNKNAVLDKIEQIRYIPHHLTNTADGLCKLSRQPWRYNQSDVIQVAVVFSDGRSNIGSHDSEMCRGDVEKVAKYIHTNHSHILVFAVGIGNNINTTELSLISTGNYNARLKGYDDLTNTLSSTLDYQVCYIMTPHIEIGREASGVMEKDQIMRWILEGVGGDGVTIRLCIKSGSISFYVSQLPNPSEAMNDDHATVTATSKLTVACTTHVVGSNLPARVKRSSQQSTESIYISIVGIEEESIFSLNMTEGNITIDINECEQDPHPCHESALCYNTDGSFYCECQESYTGNGFMACTEIEVTNSEDSAEQESQHLVVIIVVLSISLLLVLIILSAISVFFWWRKCRHERNSTNKGNGFSADSIQPRVKQVDILTAKANLKQVGTVARSVPLSATNPLAVQSAQIIKD